MYQMLTLLGPLLAMMLIPVWIPLISMTAGKVIDTFTTRQPDPIEQRRAARLARQHGMTLAETD